MKLYISHSSNYDYTNQLYKPLKAAFVSEHELILPHECATAGENTKAILPICDVVLAEVSYPSTGQGIELGWASAADVRIIAAYKSGEKPSGAINFLTSDIFEYGSDDELISKLNTLL